MVTLIDNRKNYKYWIESNGENFTRIYEKLFEDNFLMIYDSILGNISWNIYSWNEIKNHVNPLKEDEIIHEQGINSKLQFQKKIEFVIFREMDYRTGLDSFRVSIPENINLIEYCGSKYYFDIPGTYGFHGFIYCKDGDSKLYCDKTFYNNFEDLINSIIKDIRSKPMGYRYLTNSSNFIKTYITIQEVSHTITLS